MRKPLSWVFPILFLEDPNINVKLMKNITPISEEDMLDGICEKVQNFDKKYKRLQIISIFLNQVWRFKGFLNKLYCIL